MCFCRFIIQRGTIFNDFLFTPWDDVAVVNCVLFLRERICHKRSEFFSLRVDTPVKKGGKIKMTELLPLKVYPRRRRERNTPWIV